MMHTLKMLFFGGIFILCMVGTAWISSTNDSIVFFFKELTQYVEQGADTEKAVKKLTTEGVFKDPHTKSYKVLSGVTQYSPEASYNGYTLYGNHKNEVLLVDMQGEVVHKWVIPFSKIWPYPTHVDLQFFNDKTVRFADVLLLPNGNLLATYNRPGVKPWGAGVAMVDKDSNVVWNYDGLVHHWMDVSDDGRVFVLEHVMRPNQKGKWRPHSHLASNYLEDSLVVLSLETGELLNHFSLMNAIKDSAFRTLFKRIDFNEVDPTHANAVEYVTKEKAAAVPFAKEGQVLVSLNRMNALAVLDINEKKVTWANIGPWQMQHDPDILDNGNIMVFDNHGGLGFESSRVMEVNTATQQIVWSYNGTKEARLFTVTRGEQQPLPNGNILITENNGGRLLEVTRDKTIVWEYYNPLRYNPSEIADIVGGKRYAKEDLPFLEEAPAAN